ncbi:MAG: DUF3566 domain-containing protein [Marmoricola sp.]
MATSRQRGARDRPADGLEDTTTLTVDAGADRRRVGHRADQRADQDGPAAAAAGGRTRRARLRIVHVDPWSVMKTSFLLSIALGIVLVVAVAIIWGVLGAAGVWDSINSAVAQVADSPNDPTPFDITHYIGTSRVVGFALIASVIDVVLITAIATLGAFLYNLAATLLGGLEMTFTEDR